MPTKYEFTGDESNPNRVTKIELELVDFTLKITEGNGEESFIVEPDQVQQILDEAHRFNGSIIKESTSSGIDANIVKKQGGSIVEIKLDPVNSINTFHIPA